MFHSYIRLLKVPAHMKFSQNSCSQEIALLGSEKYTENFQSFHRISLRLVNIVLPLGYGYT